MNDWPKKKVGDRNPALFRVPVGSPRLFSAIRNVGPGEAQALIRENAGNRDFVLLDVRTPGEFAQGHFEGAVLVDYRSPGFREEMAGLEKKKTYLVYCRTGNRSTRALGIMGELGFRSTYHLEGGIKRWREEGMPEVR